MANRLYESLTVVSRAITEADTGTTVQAIDVPAKTLIPAYGVGVVVTEAFAGGTPLLDVGDGADADGFVDQGDITATTIGAYYGDETTTAAYASIGRYYPTADTIDVVVSASLTNGTAYVVAKMIRLAELV